MTDQPSSSSAQAPRLIRGLGVLQATSLNVANMVGIGPFITIPLFIKAMGGPHALVAWIVGALLVLCDGLVWSELGAALPGSGGTYHFLREIFLPYRWGRLLPFLFIWQFLITGTMEMASGYIGLVDYLEYVFPEIGGLIVIGGQGFGKPALAAAVCVVVTLALCRRIQVVGWLAVGLCGGTMLTVVLVIGAGMSHFQAELLRFEPGAFGLNLPFAIGLAAAMRIAIYDYLGYYNVCHLGEEVREPARTIPRAILLSVCIVAGVYLTMNTAIIGVVPWREAMESKNIAAELMQRLYGRGVAVAFTWLILWTVLACMFAITLGYSRIPFAAARNGDFFPVFAVLHRHQLYPVVSLLAIGALTAAFCLFPLGLVISSAVTVRIGVQFIGQIAGLHLLRKTRPDVQRPFHMWLYPVPSLLALVGWVFILVFPDPDYGWNTLLMAVAVNLSGCMAFVVWTVVRRAPVTGR